MEFERISVCLSSRIHGFLKECFGICYGITAHEFLGGLRETENYIDCRLVLDCTSDKSVTNNTD